MSVASSGTGAQRSGALHLPETCAAWGTPGFADVLRRELMRAGAQALPLQQALTQTSSVFGEDIEVMVISAAADEQTIQVRAGIFFAGIVAGCSCADDPTPVEAQPEYCELVITIDRRTADAVVQAD